MCFFTKREKACDFGEKNVQTIVPTRFQICIFTDFDLVCYFAAEHLVAEYSEQSDLVDTYSVVAAH